MNKKQIIKYSLIILVLIVVFSLVLLIDFNLLILKTRSIATLKSNNTSLQNAKNNLVIEENKKTSNISEKLDLQESFVQEKLKYDSISEDTVKIIQEVTKQQNYFVEYLWIELGNYSETNNLKLVVLEPDTKADFTITVKNGAASLSSTLDKKSTTATSDKTSEATETTTSSSTKINVETDKSTVKIIVVGTYQNIADFVFEVESDKDLRFKLDNIEMTYAGNNFVTATFDVLDMSVVMK